ncbi:MAG: phosphate ABC transporter permease PstA [Planctomycetes bacterium]|nr:phosphate ABC transporter permease PstA [Planctomycetota bacterium]
MSRAERGTGLSAGTTCRLPERLFVVACRAATVAIVAAFAVVAGVVVWLGASHLDAGFLGGTVSRHPERAGIWPALAGTLWTALICAVIALPIGVGAAVYLEEVEPRRGVWRRVQRFVRANIAGLAGVPSIVYGILGLTVFVRAWGLFGDPVGPAVRVFADTPFELHLPPGRGILSGGLTLALVALPLVIRSAQLALRAVPQSMRESAASLGASPLQVVARVTLPAALPELLGGSLVAVSRAVGEAAPVFVITGLVYVYQAPSNAVEPFTTLPLQVFDWANRSEPGYRELAAAACIVLLGIHVVLDTTATLVRRAFRRDWR